MRFSTLFALNVAIFSFAMKTTFIFFALQQRKNEKVIVKM